MTDSETAAAAPAKKKAQKHKRPKARATQPRTAAARRDAPQSAEFKRGEAGEAHRDPEEVRTPEVQALENAEHPAQVSSELAARSHIMGRMDRGESLDLSEKPAYLEDREGGELEAD